MSCAQYLQQMHELEANRLNTIVDTKIPAEMEEMRVLRKLLRVALQCRTCSPGSFDFSLANEQLLSMDIGRT